MDELLEQTHAVFHGAEAPVEVYAHQIAFNALPHAGSFAPGERLGRYRVGGDVAVQPGDGGAISGADYALGFVDLIEQGNHHRAHVNLAY